MDAKTLLDNFAAIADAPGGVQRLRDLAVSLGVQGGLPTGDAADEPASAVIERARIEVGLTGPRSAPADGAAQSRSLPRGWAWAEVGEIATHQLGKMLNKRTMTGRPVRYLRSVNIRDGYVDLSDLNEMLMEDYELEKYAVRDGDVLVIEGGDAGRSAIWSGPNPEGLTFQNQLHRLRPVAGILPAFLLLTLRHHRSTGEIAARSTGMTIKHFSAGALRGLPVPLPPLAEQARIVAKVTELMSLCDDLESRQQRLHRSVNRFRASALHSLAGSATADDLRRAWKRVTATWDEIFNEPESVGSLRSTILQLAVQGRLTAPNSADTSGALLVHDTVAERDGLVKSRVTRLVPDNPNYARHDPLPPGWVWAPLQDLARFIDYRGRTPKKTSSGVRLITAKNIRRGYISESPAEFIAERDFDGWMTRGLPRVGDVLFTTEAPMGNAAMVRTDERFAIAQRTINLAPYAGVSGEYLELLLLSPWFAAELEARATGMTATGIKAAKLRLIRVPVPPPEEQVRIVDRTRTLLALCSDLEQTLRKQEISQVAVSVSLAAAMTA